MLFIHNHLTAFQSMLGLLTMTIKELRSQREIPLDVEITYEHVVHELSEKTSLVYCTLCPRFHKANNVRAVAFTVDEAMDKAWALLQRVAFLEKMLGERLPLLIRDQTYEYAESSNVYENYHVTWRTVRDHVRLVIEDVTRKSTDGWFIHDEPYKEKLKDMIEVTESFKEEKIPNHDPLEEGETLWYWNDIYALAGSAGFCIVKKGKIVRSLQTRRG